MFRPPAPATGRNGAGGRWGRPRRGRRRGSPGVRGGWPTRARYRAHRAAEGERRGEKRPPWLSAPWTPTKVGRGDASAPPRS